MDSMDDLKKAVESIRLSAEARARISARLAEAKAPARRRRRLRPGVLIAAAVIAALLATGAGAAYIREYYNPEIVDGWEDMRTPPPAYSEDEPNGYSAYMGVEDYTPPTLEIQTGRQRKKFSTWDTDEEIQGSVSGSHEWTDLEVLAGSGDILVRDVFATDGTSKREYTAADPALLCEMFEGAFSIDFSCFEDNYKSVPYANLYYMESAENGSRNGTEFAALYAVGSDGGWLQFDCTTMYTRSIPGTDYILADTYDDVYTYTNASGLEFVITVNGDSINAGCMAEHISISVRGAYITTADIEAAVDCITFTE